MKTIQIQIGNQTYKAELYHTPTAEKIYETIPYEGKATLWGEEIYFTIPLILDEEPDAREVVERGELAFWSYGSAFCIFFGPTPVSTDNRPRAYSAVNVFGKIVGDFSGLRDVFSGDNIYVFR